MLAGNNIGTLQFIESINSGGIKDYDSCEKAIQAYNEIFKMEVWCDVQ